MRLQCSCFHWMPRWFYIIVVISCLSFSQFPFPITKNFNRKKPNTINHPQFIQITINLSNYWVVYWDPMLIWHTLWGYNCSRHSLQLIFLQKYTHSLSCNLLTWTSTSEHIRFLEITHNSAMRGHWTKLHRTLPNMPFAKQRKNLNALESFMWLPYQIKEKLLCWNYNWDR